MTPTDPPLPHSLLLQELARLQDENAQLREQLFQQHAQRVHAKAPGVSNATVAHENNLERLRHAFEATELALWDWDLTTGRVYLSAQWGQITGGPIQASNPSIEELLALVHPDDLAQVRQHLAELFHGHAQRYRAEHRVQTPRGWVWVESVGLPQARDRHGHITRIIGTNANITPRKEVQQQLTVAQARAEQASQAKSDFLANMSHEVRTPLNTLMGLTRLLQRTDINAQQKEYLDLMDSSATALLALLNDILDLSKIEAGKLVFEQVRFDLLAWVEKAVSPFQAQARAKDLQVYVEADPSLPHYLMGDPGRLRQVLGNLMSNAVKFTSQGHILVKIWPDPDKHDIPSGRVRLFFEVRDTGIGINAEQQRSIFEAFTQADPSTTRQYGGTGLGLTICQRLIEMMDGQIRVASVPGQGSAFRFSATFGEAPEHPTEITVPVALEERTLSGLRVLLAEDHPVNQLITRKLLEEMGCQVEIAVNGQEAVARWLRGDINLILMDIQMPVLGGEAATQQIRTHERASGGHVPIIALTAHALAGDRERYLSQGMDGYVSKPIAPDSLARAMHEVLRPLQEQDTQLHPMLPAFEFAPAPPNPHHEVFNPEHLLAQLGGDRSALQELTQAMREDLNLRMAQLRLAAANENADLGARHAHALKGSLATLTLDRGAALAGGLELAARKGEWPLFKRALGLLEQEAIRIDQALNVPH